MSYVVRETTILYFILRSLLPLVFAFCIFFEVNSEGGLSMLASP